MIKIRAIKDRYRGMRDSPPAIVEATNVTYENWKNLQRLDTSIMTALLRGKEDCDLLFKRHINPDGSVGGFVEQHKFGKVGKIGENVHIGHNAVVSASATLSGNVKIMGYAIIGEIEVSRNVVLSGGLHKSNYYGRTKITTERKRH